MQKLVPQHSGLLVQGWPSTAHFGWTFTGALVGRGVGRGVAGGEGGPPPKLDGKQYSSPLL